MKSQNYFYLSVPTFYLN